ncbi:PREDICTED: adenylyl cyclase-associated protein 1 [Galeopterus variegatus]|uniref:Adenylyl cyclase-associated protein n=1 Tax=Galeopterus variegatus TaxID=482537 RepID=A0ABM0RCY5_GALVR|nr:PREDICTED: adenylyl cyclase-associated protein 1 [Galeopterus variegatus]
MADMQNLVERLERAVGRLEAVSHTSDMYRGYGDSPSKAGAAPYVQAFDSLLASPVAEYLKISKEIGGDVQRHAEMVHTGLKLERALLVTASQCQQPAGNKLSDLLAPISEQIQEVITFREKNRGSKLFNHLSAVSESIQALGWVAMAPKPGPYVKEMNDAAMFYTNRVLKEYKDVDKKHVDWVKAYLSIWTELQAYIKEYHTTGLAWSKTGPLAKELSGLPSGPSAGSGPPPPPPGPPPPPVPTSSGSDESASRSALFAQINQGESITHDKCVNTTLQVKGKINSITVDNCKKLGLVFDDVVGIVEIINSRDVKVQVMGKVPTISINKTDGCHVYLSKNSLDCEIVSAKSSEMNVLIPTEGGDFNEFPVPEQFKTLWNGQKLVTTVTEIAG